MLRVSFVEYSVAPVVLALAVVVVGKWDTTPDTVRAQTSDCTHGLAVPDPTNNPGLVSDCEALLAARDILAGDASLNWSATSPILDWSGIVVDGDPLRVKGVLINSMELTGEIPSSLGSLSHLQKLNLAFNHLTGGIPAELGNLSNLRELLLHANSLDGEIPQRCVVSSNWKY